MTTKCEQGHIDEVDFKEGGVYLVKEPRYRNGRLFEGVMQVLHIRGFKDVTILSVEPEDSIEEIPTELLERVLVERREQAAKVPG